MLGFPCSVRIFQTEDVKMRKCIGLLLLLFVVAVSRENCVKAGSDTDHGRCVTPEEEH